MTRKRFNEREVIETLAWQGVVIPCFRCKEPLCYIGTYRLTGDEPVMIWPKGDGIQREHLHELGLARDEVHRRQLDVPGNCRFSHESCHAVITNGTPATSAGSSKHRIAKTRGTRAEKFAVQKLSIDSARPEKRRGRRR